MKSICVFCGANSGDNPLYKKEALNLGKLFIKYKYKLIYGAGKSGLMGAVSKEVIDNKGHVIGITTKYLVGLEGTQNNLTELYILNNILDRKKMMYEKSNAFIALPGGIGTLDEISLVLTLKQIRLMTKKVVLINTNNYWNGFMDWLKSTVIKDNFLIPVDNFIYIAENSTKAFKFIDRNS